MGHRLGTVNVKIKIDKMLKKIKNLILKWDDQQPRSQGSD